VIALVGKAVVVWGLIAIAEVVHGILRVRFLNRRVGDRRARQIAVFTGSGLILIIAWALVPWINPGTVGQCYWIGLLWFVSMLAFEIGFGRFVFRASWKRLLSDFDFRQGGLLSIGMAILFFAPLIAAKIHGLV
jgi:hypothetical protein